MDEKLPRIHAVSLGGTWCMRREKAALPSGSDYVKVASALGEQFDINSAFPAVRSVCSADFKELRALDSSNLTPAHWTELARYIAALRDHYDGFVVLQGTDTLAFTAAALAFALCGLSKPVILTGAQLEMDAPGSDAPQNVTNAFRIASLHQDDRPLLTEVAVIFGSQVIRGTRCRKYSERDLEAFGTVNVPLLGKIRTSIRIDPAVRLTAVDSGPEFVSAANFDPNVTLLHLYPGLRPNYLRTIGQDASGVVIAAYGAGNIPSSSKTLENPYSLEEAIADLVQSGKPVVVTTQCVTGLAEVGLYEAGSRARVAGAIIANDMTPEAAFVKLSWILANQDRWPRNALRAAAGPPGQIGALRAAFLHPYAGEISDNRDIRSAIGSV